MNIQRANLQDVLSFYLDRQTASTAFEVLNRMISQREHLQLANILRNHRVRPVYSIRERYMRACVDDLLLCYNVLEISILTGFIADPDDSSFWKQTKKILLNKQVREYMEDFYPQSLPQLLSLRLSINYSTAQLSSTDFSSFMLRFLALDKAFMQTLNDSYLLSMLDSFTIQGYRFRDVVALINEPAVFTQRILLPPERRTIPDVVLHEFGEFVQFCTDLVDLLESVERYPLLQSSVWNHYGYWLQSIGQKMKKRLGMGLDRFLTWRRDDPNDQAAMEIKSFVLNAKDVMRKLTAEKYAIPVSEALKAARQIPIT